VAASSLSAGRRAVSHTAVSGTARRTVPALLEPLIRVKDMAGESRSSACARWEDEINQSDGRSFNQPRVLRDVSSS
jgi:hypothetical protein